MRHILSLLLENESGALSRVAGLIAARGYNIESLTVAPTDDATVSRMTLVTSGDDAIIEQITKQLNKLVDVIKLVDVTEGEHIERELMLVKVKAATAQARDDVQRVAQVFRAHVVDLTRATWVVELTGGGEKLEAFLAALDPAAILEVVRSGPSAISRGSKALRA
jgi:acetolactate synthase I/III small subunit